MAFIFPHESAHSFSSPTNSTSLGLWVIDVGVIDHILGNKSLFLFISSSGYLPALSLWLMAPKFHLLLLVLSIFSCLYPFTMSLGLHLIYYPAVISPLLFIMLFLLQKTLLKDQNSRLMIGNE